MLSTVDLERLIAVKRREIEKEKTRLGLASSRSDERKDNEAACPGQHVSEGERRQNAGEEERETEDIPPDLDRYIRRYLGLPVMLKAGEYSPNNPLIRGERAAGDALLGLGEYERRRNTLRKMRQQQYREYLDQQAKKKQEEKEQAERARREREQREREEEERERERLERERVSPERPRAYTNTVFAPQSFPSKVDMGVQTTGVGRPLSVAVQTDDAELYGVSPPQCALTTAERELSPRTVRDSNPRPRASQPAAPQCKAAPRYRPAIFDADAVQLRNTLAEQEAAAKRQFYQQELRNQIQEQQRIREERKAREKMLEQAEMRRLEEQLRMLRVAQEGERAKQFDVTDKMRENATDYEKKRTALQKEIDLEQRALRAPRPLPQKPPYSTISDKSIFSPNYDVDSYLRKNLNPSKESLLRNRHTANSEMSLSSKYLNLTNNDGHNDYNINYSPTENQNVMKNKNNIDKTGVYEKRVVDKATVHDRPIEKKYEPSRRVESDNPIPVLRHSPVVSKVPDSDLSDAMKVVEDKWKVPVVQRNILKSLPNEDGKNVNILTQLGSIRRQLQLEQLKLDKMLPNDDI